MNENDEIPIQISLRFVQRSLIENKPALIQVKWLAPNRQQAITWTKADPVHRCIYAALVGVNEFYQSWN